MAQAQGPAPPRETPFDDREIIERPVPEAPEFSPTHRPPAWDIWYNPAPLKRLSLRVWGGIASFRSSVLGHDVNPYSLTYGSVLQTTTLGLGLSLDFTLMKILGCSLSFSRLTLKPDRGSPGSTIVPNTEYVLNFGSFDLYQLAFSIRAQFPINVFNIARDEEVFSDDLFRIAKATDVEGILPYIRIGLGAAHMKALAAVHREDLGGGNWVETDINYLHHTTNLMVLGGLGIEFKFSFLSIFLEVQGHLNGKPTAKFRADAVSYADPDEFGTWIILVGIGFHL
jgi:hypothetical protein